ncbi:NADPH:quinone oxidoreductase family protein [Amycolatopsis acidicola]|uniref:NADPH:quinone oxidoreductase family protein n=1 Tax=Amycolatopsis acidicola TaxID=2596893 RepID=A0A5N0UH62_9PSEU|nr:NADPH:quinone oxidoreductase family protein [Amycolatopsis acidicola]KAA9147796.1 NADPH:quinone oxidoreductase family protein [Amycolatopsis acidicola]
MRAAICEAYGPPENVRVTEIDAPALAAGKVRVRVGAAAVNFPDVLVAAGTYQVKVPVPFVVGSEFAGVITEVAEDVREFAAGDRVTGTGITGAFAEEVVAGTRGLVRIPDGITDRQAAAFGVAYRTAYHSLRSMAGLQVLDQLVVLGAGGGVGLAAVQLGARLGAKVTAVASTPEKLAAAESHGATNLIDHRAGDLREALREAIPDGADVVLDPVGGALSEPALRSMRRGGRFVTIGYASGEIPRIPLNLVLIKGVRILGFQFQDVPPPEFRRNEAELAALLAEQRALPHIGATYPLADAAKALRQLADGKAVGKIVLDVSG